jgi:hypothetical protein
MSARGVHGPRDAFHSAQYCSSAALHAEPCRRSCAHARGTGAARSADASSAATRAASSGIASAVGASGVSDAWWKKRGPCLPCSDGAVLNLLTGPDSTKIECASGKQAGAWALGMSRLQRLHKRGDCDASARTGHQARFSLAGRLAAAAGSPRVAAEGPAAAPRSLLPPCGVRSAASSNAAR